MLDKKSKIWYNFIVKKGGCMMVVKITSKSIKLGQFLKFSGVVLSGGEVKEFLQKNDVFVNGKLEKQRGKQLFNGDIIEIKSQKYQIEANLCD